MSKVLGGDGSAVADRCAVGIAESIGVVAQRRTDIAAVRVDKYAALKRVALIRLQRLGEAAGRAVDSAAIADGGGIDVANNIAAIAQRRTDGAAGVNDQAIGKVIALGRNRGLCEAAGEHHRASIADAGTVAIADIIVVIAQRRTDGAALADAEAVAERVALIRLQRLGEAAGAVIGQRRRTSIVDGGIVGGGDSIAAIAQRRTDGAALADADAVAERVALIRLRRLGEAAGAVIGQRHRTLIDDVWKVVGGDSIAAIAQRRTDGAALADAEAVAERVALIRLPRLGEAAGAVIGQRHRTKIEDVCNNVGGGDSIAAIAQRRTDGAALADVEAVAERVALIRLRRLGEAAGAVIGQRHRTSIVDGGIVGGGDSIAAIAQRRTDGAALADAEAVAERVALIRLRRLGEAAGAVIGQRHRTSIGDDLRQR